MKPKTTEARYIEPKSATDIFNNAVGRLTRLGISVYGSRVLASGAASPASGGRTR